MALLASPSLAPCLAKSANALSNIYYIDASSGNDTYNDGSREKPYKTIDAAISKNKGDLELHLLGNEKYATRTTSENDLFGDGHDNISIIGEIGDDDIYPQFTLSGSNAFIGTNLTLNNIEYTNGKENVRYTLYACGNNLTFGDNCKVDNASFVATDPYDTGIEYGREFLIFSGCNGAGGKGNVVNNVLVSGPGIKGKTLESNSNTLTFLSGDFGKVILANRLCDTGTKDNHYQPKVVVGGNAYVSYLGGANDWINFIDGTITVKDQARVHRIVGGILGYKYASSVPQKVYVHSGRTTININGGYVKNIIGGSMGRTSAYVRQEGDTYINVTNGYVESLIGGSAAGNTHGNIHINVSGGHFGNISNDVLFGIKYVENDVEKVLCDEKHEAGFYCGGAGMSSLIHTGENVVDEIFSSTGGCYVEEDILDSSKKVMAMGNVYGDIFANITGGTFECNIYGGGKGFDHTKTSPSDKKNALFNV